MSNTHAPLCACGCGQATSRARSGRFNKYLQGHNSKSPGNTGGQWRTGQSGNPAGRQQGSRNNVTVASESLLEGEGEALTRKLIDLALAGNVACLRHAIDRIHPVKRSAPIRLEGMPEVNDISSAAEASGYLLQQVRDGVVSPIDAEVVSRLIDKYITASRWTDIEEKLHELQARLDAGGKGSADPSS